MKDGGEDVRGDVLEAAPVTEDLRELDICGCGEKGWTEVVFQQSLCSQGDLFLSPQSATDIGQIQQLQLQLEEAKKEKHKLQEQVRAQSCHIVWGGGEGLPLGPPQKLSFIHSLIRSTSVL